MTELELAKQVDWELAVMQIYPDAVCMKFDLSEHKYHIRLYAGDDLPKSLGKGHTPSEAWINAYQLIKHP